MYKMVRLIPKKTGSTAEYNFDTHLDEVRIYNDLPLTHKFKSFKKNGNTRSNGTTSSDK